MRRAVIKVQSAPLATPDGVTDKFQELCSQTLAVNIDDLGDVFVDDNPKLEIYGEGCLLLASEFEIIMEK